MRSRLGVVAIVLASLAVGTTLASYYLTRKGDRSSDSETHYAQTQVKTMLTFPISDYRLEGSGSPSRGLAYESNSSGHFDFWFKNEKDQAIDLNLFAKSCTCASVAMALTPPEYRDWFSRYSLEAARFALPSTGLIDAGSALHSLNGMPTWPDAPDLKWTNLIDHPQVKVSIPAGSVGIVRLKWQTPKPGPHHMGAALHMTPDKGRGGSIEINVPIVVLEPLRFDPVPWQAGELHDDSPPVQTVLTCWSSTRKHFELSPIASMEPFLQCGTPIPLTPHQCLEIASQHETRVLSGYYIPVTLKERLAPSSKSKDAAENEMKYLDYGPYRGTLKFLTDFSKDIYEVPVQGVVRKPGLAVKQGMHPDEISFGAYRGNQAGRSSATVCVPPGMDVELEDFPPFLKVELKREDGNLSLLVETIPGQISEPFPTAADPEGLESSIYLKLSGTPLRRLRIPVSGQPTFR